MRPWKTGFDARYLATILSHHNRALGGLETPSYFRRA
jgi:hypothetical protein